MSIFDHKPEYDAEVIFGLHNDVTPDPVATSVRAYIIARYARAVLTNKLAGANAKQTERIRKTLADITADLHVTRRYFRDENVKVPAEPDDAYYGGVKFTYWHAGKSVVCGWTVAVIRRDIRRCVERYFNA